MKPAIIALAFLSIGEFTGRTNATVTWSQGPRQEAVAIQLFLQGVDRYMALRKEALATVPAPKSLDPWALSIRQENVAEAIRARRSNARVGDLFTREVQVAFRAIIDRSICAEGLTAEEVVRSIELQVMPGAAPPAVNRPFPWQLGAMMPSYLRADLPPLPLGIQYRIVGHDLLLIDMESTLVVDILREALVPMR